MKPKLKSYALVTGNATNLVELVTLAATGIQIMTLDGELIVAGVLPVQEMGYIVLITSVGNDSGITFTIVGTDVDGAAQTEVVTGPNATTTVSTKFFRSISSITASGDTAGDVSIGTSNATLSALTPTLALDMYSPATSVAVNISGTINYDLLKCFERPTAGDELNFVAGGLATQTTDGNTAYAAPVGGVRVEVNSYTNGATLKLAVVQSRQV